MNSCSYATRCTTFPIVKVYRVNRAHMSLVCVAIGEVPDLSRKNEGRKVSPAISMPVAIVIGLIVRLMLRQETLRGSRSDVLAVAADRQKLARKGLGCKEGSMMLSTILSTAQLFDQQIRRATTASWRPATVRDGDPSKDSDDTPASTRCSTLTVVNFTSTRR
jgi:hypothetical protein